MFLAIFFSSLYIGAQERIERIERGQSGTQLVFDLGAGRVVDDESTVIGSNSSFVFLVSDNGYVEVIPWHEVQSITREPQ